MGIVLHGGPHDSSVARAWPTTRAFGGRGPYCWSANRRRAHASSSSPDSDLEAFSHNPAHGSFAPLAFQPSAMTNCAESTVPLVLAHLRTPALSFNRCAAPAKLPTYNVFRPDRPAEAGLGSKKRALPRFPIHGIIGFPLSVPVLSWLFDARGRPPKEPFPSPSPGRHAATRSRRGSSSSSPPTADGFGTGTPVPSPQSQSFSRGYGSILPTSLAYIVPSTRGCSPWRPRCGYEYDPGVGGTRSSGFSRAAGGAPDTARRADERFARQYRCGPPPEFPLGFAPLRHSSPSFGSRQACSHSNPSQKIKVGRRCTPLGGSRQSASLRLAGLLTPLTRTHVRLLGPCFKTGRMGCPQAGAREHAGISPRRRVLPTTIDATASPRAYRQLGLWPPHQSAPVHAPSRSADRLSPFHIRPGRIAGPHSLPSRQFQALFDSLFKVLFIFPSRYLFAIGLTPTAPRGATGSGHDGALTLSGAPFQGTWARSAAEDASPDYNSDSEAVRFSSWADPGSLAVTKGILWNSRDVAGGEPPTSPRS
ncbi:hypothetical protein L1887_47711 [Cichorium endivia]|nr:hypothetical protein L1887_47711 [Cichorium endivia]